MVAVRFGKRQILAHDVADLGRHEPELKGSAETFPFQKSEVPGSEVGLETRLPDRFYKTPNSYIQCD